MSEERSKVYEGQSQKESEGKLLQEHFQFLAGMPACINPIFTQYFIPFCPFPGRCDEKIHTGQMQYNCLQCNSSFESRHEQISHNRSEHKMWKCQTRRCNLRFQSLSSFTEHLTLRFECILCKKTFRFQSHFNYHVYIHNNPPKCNICSQNFATYKQLELHRIIHTNEKPYKCDLCQMSFNNHGSLSRHKRIHSPDKKPNV